MHQAAGDKRMDACNQRTVSQYRMTCTFPNYPHSHIYLLVALETAQDWGQGEQIYISALKFKGHDPKQEKEECPKRLSAVLK